MSCVGVGSHHDVGHTLERSNDVFNLDQVHPLTVDFHLGVSPAEEMQPSIVVKAAVIARLKGALTGLRIAAKHRRRLARTAKIAR